MKTKRLDYQEQTANFNHLINIIEGAKTYKQLKSVFVELNKIEREAKKVHEEDCWVLSKDQSDEIFEAYNFHKYERFGEEAEAEDKQKESIYQELMDKIKSAKSTGELREINIEVYRSRLKNSQKKELSEFSRGAYQELLEYQAEQSA